MAFLYKNATVSEILKSDTDDEPKKKCRDDWRKAKELEEARKAGTAPAAVDEEGKDINPHIPQYISSSPWYYGSKGPTLKHQRIQPSAVPQYSGIDEWYKRGVNTESVVVKYRPGACENCGAMTHKKKDCMERPRKIGAKFNNSEIAPDEFVQPVLNQSYDGKRDRWAGYDPSQHKRIIEQYQRVEEAKRQLRADKLDTSITSEEGNEAVDDEEDEDKYVDEVDMPGTKVDSKQRITVRNLRIREDTAKYLRNLDLNSAYYDPKTRSMRDNPHETADPEQVDYAGENFVRFTGDTSKHASAQLFAWEAYEKGVNVHLLAEPTKLEKLKHEYEEKKDEYKKCVQKEVLEKYGGEEHLTNVPPKELLLAQTEEYREYSRSGKVIKGEEKVKIRSKYEEDVYNGNHTSVWGSYWRNGEWGYRCCHSFVKNSYCTGEAGKATSSTVIGTGVGVAVTTVMPNQIRTGTNLKTDQSIKAVDSNDDTNVAVKKNQKMESAVISGKKKLSSKSSSSSSEFSSESSSESSTESSSDSSSSSSSSDSEDEKQRKKRRSKHLQSKKQKKLKKKKREKKRKHNNKRDKECKVDTDDKLKQALKKYAANEKLAESQFDDRKRPYNSMYDVKKPTDEDMEAYYMKRRRDMDPMAGMLGR